MTDYIETGLFVIGLMWASAVFIAYLVGGSCDGNK